MNGLPPRLYADLIGKPYVPNGRGPDAYDCLGLAIELQRRRGLAVPDFVSEAAELHRQLADGGFLAECTCLDSAEPGCVVLLRSNHLAQVHLGVMVDRFYMLHTEAQVGSCLRERLQGSPWQRRVMGFYRLESNFCEIGDAR